MSTLAVLPELVGGVGRALAQAVGSGRTHGWPPEAVEETVHFFVQFRRAAATSRKAVERSLEGGVEVRAFLEDSALLCGVLRRFVEDFEELERNGTIGGVPQAVAGQVAASRREQTDFLDFLEAAREKARESPHALDWTSLKRESDADFAAGRFTAYDNAEAAMTDLTSDE
jgi:hypothetical protein